MTSVVAENANRDAYIDPVTGDIAILVDTPGNPVATAQLCKSRIAFRRVAPRNAIRRRPGNADDAHGVSAI